MLLAREVHDPGIGFVTLTRVQVTPDLQQARVYYTALGDDKARATTAQRARPRRAVPAPPDRRRGCGCKRVPELEVRLRRVDRRPGPHRAAAATRSTPAARGATPDADDQMTTTSPELAAHRRRDPRAAAVRALLARAARRRLDRLAAGDGVRAARARQGGRRSSTPTPAPAPLMAFPGVPRHRDRRARRRRVRRRDHHGVRRPGAHRRRRARSRSSSSTSITIPATPATAQINWFDATRRGLRRDGVRPGRARSACR